MPRDALMSYMRRHYTTANTVVAAAGNLEHERVVDLVARHFADLPASRGAAAPSRAATRAANSARRATSTRCTSCSAFPSVAYGDADYYPTMLLSTLLGGGMSSRLFQEVREKRGLVYSIYSFTAPYMDGGLFGIYAGTGESEVDGTDPGHAGRTAEGAGRRDRGRAGARARAGEGGAADVAGKHRQPLRAARAADPGVRPHHADRGDGGEDRAR